ncbi:MAG: hypothetical protein ABJA67_00065 [Chthonomonadales bacterium]
MCHGIYAIFWFVSKIVTYDSGAVLPTDHPAYAQYQILVDERLLYPMYHEYRSDYYVLIGSEFFRRPLPLPMNRYEFAVGITRIDSLMRKRRFDVLMDWDNTTEDVSLAAKNAHAYLTKTFVIELRALGYFKKRK